MDKNHCNCLSILIWLFIGYIVLWLMFLLVSRTWMALTHELQIKVCSINCFVILMLLRDWSLCIIQIERNKKLLIVIHNKKFRYCIDPICDQPLYNAPSAGFFFFGISSIRSLNFKFDLWLNQYLWMVRLGIALTLLTLY